MNEILNLDIPEETKTKILSIFDKLMTKYQRPDNEYFDGVVDGINHCRKVIEGIEDDYLSDIK